MSSKPNLYSDRIKNFAISIMLDAFIQSAKENAETRIKVREAILKVLNVVLDGKSCPETHIRTGIEGLVEGVLVRRRGLIDILQSESDFLQARLNYEKQQLKDEVELVIEELQNVSESQSNDVSEIIRNAIAETNYLL